jgi:hypothetical protein
MVGLLVAEDRSFQSAVNAIKVGGASTPRMDLSLLLSITIQLNPLFSINWKKRE